MKGWKLVVLFCTALLCEPVRPDDKWSRPEAAEKRIDDWVPITATCPTCPKNAEPNGASGTDEIGSLLNPPAVPSGRAFNFNAKQNNFKRAPAGEPYEITTPQPATSAQFFSQQQPPKIPQPVHFPIPFFGQQGPFQTRFQGLPNFQPQFTFIPQPQIQPLPKENKVTFPDSPFIQQQNKGSVQLVYVPIEAIQRQKPRAQADRPNPQQSPQLDVKTQSPFETGKLKFQRPPQPFDQSRFPSAPQFGQEINRFAPPPASFEQDTGRFPPPSQIFEQEKPTFPTQLKEQRPEFLPQNEQPAAPQSYQFVEDIRNPPSNFFQYHDSRFQKPTLEGEKPKESKPQVQQTFAPNTDESKQESAQSFVSNFDGNRPRQGPPQNFQETRPRQEQPPQSFQQQNFQETRPRQEQQPQHFQQNFQETRPQTVPPSFQETRPRQEASPPQFVPKFEQPKIEPQPQFIPNFQETGPRQEPPPQFVPKFDEPKIEPQPQFIPNFQETRPRQEPPPQFVPNFQDIPQQEAAQQTFTPNFESLRPEVPQNFIPEFQETRPNQESPATFVQNFEEIKPKSKPKVQFLPSSTPTPQQTLNLPSSTEEVVQTSSTPYPPPHQPPLSVYMERRLDNKINEVLTILKDAKTIPVLDTIGNRSPKVFVGPSDLDAPRGYVKFELPYLSSLDITKIESMADRLPFFVAPLNFKPPFGYAKIPFPPPHIGSVVVSSKSQTVASSTEFVPFALTSQLPTEVNSLQPSVSSTTQRVTEKVQQSTDVTPSSPKRNRQRKPLHRGSLTSFSTSTPINDITERQRDQFTTPSELQRLPESSPSVNEQQQQQFLESTPTPIRHKYSRKPVEQTTVFETTPAPIQQQEQQFDSQQQQQFDNSQQQQFDITQPQQFNNPQQQQFDNSQQQQFDITQPQQFNNPQQQQFDITQPQKFNNPKQQQFENSPRQQFNNPQRGQFDNSQQQQFENSQQQFDKPQQQQFYTNKKVPQTQQDYLDTLPKLTQQEFSNNEQQPSQQPFYENQQQYLDNPSQTVQEQIPTRFEDVPQSQTEINNQNNDQQQFVSSTTEKQIFKNFQQIQPLSQYQVSNNFLNQQQSSTEQIQSASNPPQTVSSEPQTVATVAATETPKLRQRLSYYDKLMLTSTRAPVENTSAQNVIETSEKPRERPKLRPRQRLTTTTATRRTTTESAATPEDVSAEQVTEPSTPRYNPLKRRRPTTSTTTTTEQAEVTRNPLRSRVTQAGRSDFIRSRSRKPTTTTTTTTTSTTTTTETAPLAQQPYEDDNVGPIGGQDEQKRIEEAASFWNEPVTIQQSQSYELEAQRYTQAPAAVSDGRFAGGDQAAEDFSKEKHVNEKKAHDPNSEKKAPGGRRGHWVRVRVKKPQDNLDTAESQNSLGPLSANAIRELVTKPTVEFSSSPRDAQTTAVGPTTTTTTEPETVTPEASTTAAETPSTTTAVPPPTAAASTTTTTTTTSQPFVTTTAVSSDYADGAVTEERPYETTATAQASPSAKYPDDEQDEVFQRNLADMLAKFIGGGNNNNDDGGSQRDTTAATATDEESTAEADQQTVTPPTAVTETPAAPVTSTTTKVSMETEICYKGRCVKSKKNKQITDSVSEP